MSSNERPLQPHYLVSALALAAAYMTTGLAARALPLEPGYPTAVWPPAGIALAAVLMLGHRVWPGVFLGALLVNIDASMDASNLHRMLWSVAPPLTIAVGATAQALASAWLIHRVVGPESPLSSTRGMILMPLLGGPVGCVLSASIGAMTLLQFRLIEPVELPFSWFTWWIGDVIGVIVFTPILLLISDPTVSGGFRRRLLVVVPLSAALAVVIAAFQFASHLEERSLRSDFDRAAEQAGRVMEREFDEYLFVLDEVQSLFSISRNVTAEQFEEFAGPLVRRHAGMRAMEWAPVTDAAGCEQLARQMRTRGFDVPFIFALDVEGRRIPTSGPGEVVPICYVTSERDNHAAIGYDLASEARRRRAMQRSAADAAPHATSPIRLIQGAKPGVLVFQAVHDDHKLAGYVVLVLQIDEMIAAWLRRANTGEMQVALYDRGPEGRVRTRVHGEEPDLPSTPSAEVELNRAGRHWSLVFSAHSLGGHSLQAWSVMAGGMLFTGFLSMFMLVVSGQSAELEEAVEVRTAELGTLAQRLQRVLDSVGEGICGVDLQCRTTFVNAAAARMTGHPVEALIGRDLHDILHGTGCDATCLLRDCLHDGETRTGIDHEVRRADGARMAIEYVKAPIVDDGGIAGAVVAFKDITERLAMDRMKDEFISVVSHELRTPLTAIQGALGLLASGKTGSLPPPALRLAELGLRNSERLVHLVNDILDMERLESGQAALERADCDAAILCSDAVDSLRPVAEKAGVRLEVDCPHLAVWVDPLRIAQVLTNLVGNAVKFSFSGKAIRVTATPDGDCVRFEVRDEGRGIPAENLDSIFDRFRQVDSSDSRERGGTGLGLAICKAIVTQHGGRIWAESQVGTGSTFKFTVPASSPVA